MPKLSDIYTPSGNYIKADDLKGRDPAEAKITGFDQGEWPDGSKRFELVLEFDNGAVKQMTCNKTNGKRIAAMHGDEIDDWKGKKITIFYDPNVEYGGEIKGGLRVKLPEAAPTGKKAAFLSENPAEGLPKDEIPF